MNKIRKPFITEDGKSINVGLAKGLGENENQIHAWIEFDNEMGVLEERRYFSLKELMAFQDCLESLEADLIVAQEEQLKDHKPDELQ